MRCNPPPSTTLPSLARFLDGVEDLIARERALVLEELSLSLKGTQKVIGREPAAVLEDMDRQRALVSAEASAIIEERIDHTTCNDNRVVDRVLGKLTFRLAGFVLALLQVGAILIYLAGVLLRPAPPAEVQEEARPDSPGFLGGPDATPAGSV